MGVGEWEGGGGGGDWEDPVDEHATAAAEGSGGCEGVGRIL